MAVRNQKQAKRKYTKRQKEIINNIELVTPFFPKEKEEIDELTFLDLTVQQLDKMDESQKSRFLNYIHSRYSDYFATTFNL